MRTLLVYACWSPPSTSTATRATGSDRRLVPGGSWVWRPLLRATFGCRRARAVLPCLPPTAMASASTPGLGVETGGGRRRSQLRTHHDIDPARPVELVGALERRTGRLMTPPREQRPRAPPAPARLWEVAPGVDRRRDAAQALALRPPPVSLGEIRVLVQTGPKALGRAPSASRTVVQALDEEHLGEPGVVPRPPARPSSPCAAFEMEQVGGG